MNRTFHVQPLSLCLGVALALVAFFTMSQVAAPSIPTHRVECGPHPGDMIQFGGAQPYVVPQGKTLVLTAVGGTDPYEDQVVWVEVNGQREFRVTNPSTGGSSVRAIPTGFTVQSGGSVRLMRYFSTTNTWTPEAAFRAWGYLAGK